MMESSKNFSLIKKLRDIEIIKMKLFIKIKFKKR